MEMNISLERIKFRSLITVSWEIESRDCFVWLWRCKVQRFLSSNTCNLYVLNIVRCVIFCLFHIWITNNNWNTIMIIIIYSIFYIIIISWSHPRTYQRLGSSLLSSIITSSLGTFSGCSLDCYYSICTIVLLQLPAVSETFNHDPAWHPGMQTNP